MKLCPCGTGNRYLECCGQYLLKKATAQTAEILMRSRYSAFAEGDVNYIRKTMRAPALLKFNKKEFLKRLETWQGLEVINAFSEEENPEIAFVEFIAKYSLGNVEGSIHEISEFHLIEGQWYYVDGK